jgi:Ribbon-helix-helix protein, copG family
MFDAEDKMFQFNVRLPETMLRAIESAAEKEKKSLSEFVRMAALAAVCHSHREEPVTVYIDPGEKIKEERARELGMAPVAKRGADWTGEVRVTISKKGYYKDVEGGLWFITPQGLKFVMGRAKEKTKREAPSLEKIVSIYDPIQNEGFRVSKPFPNTYAQIFPEMWPQGTGEVQYRFFKQNQTITPELCLNPSAVERLGEKKLRSIKKSLEKALTERTVDWLSKGRRLRIIYGPESTDRHIADGMVSLIDTTFKLLDPIVQSLADKRTM